MIISNSDFVSDNNSEEGNRLADETLLDRAMWKDWQEEMLPHHCHHHCLRLLRDNQQLMFADASLDVDPIRTKRCPGYDGRDGFQFDLCLQIQKTPMQKQAAFKLSSIIFIIHWIFSVRTDDLY